MRKIITFLALIGSLFVHSQEDPSWATKTDLGYNLDARSDAGMVAIGNYLYILGGYSSCGPKNFIKYHIQTGVVTQLKNLGTGCANPIRNGVMFTAVNKIYSFQDSYCYVYDITTNEWTSYSAAGLNMTSDTGFMIGNIIYVSSTSGNNFVSFNTITNSFTQKANYPGSPNRRSAMSFDLGGKGYIMGGTLPNINNCSSSGCISSDVYEYNPVTDTWIVKNNMPKGITGGSSISHNGKGYAGLGQIFILTTSYKSPYWYEYNPLIDSWSAMQNYMNVNGNDYNNTVTEAAIAKIANDLYIFGGSSKGNYDVNKDDITKYNTTSNTWSVVNEDPGKNRTEASGFYLNGKIYTGGGIDSEGLNDFWQYDIATDEWLQRTSLPSNHTQRACVELNGKGYFIGGYDRGMPTGSNVQDKLLEYNPTTDVFIEKASFPAQRFGMVAFVYDGKIYAGLGKTIGQIPMSDFYMYNPQTDTWLSKASAPITGAHLSHFILGTTGYVLSSNSNMTAKYDFITDSWSTAASNLPYTNSLEYSNQGFAFEGCGYVVHGSSTEVDRLSKFNPITETWTSVLNIPFKKTGNTIIPTPNEVYFGFGDHEVNAEFGVRNTNTLDALRFGAGVSDATGVYSSKTAYIFNYQLSCGTGPLVSGIKHSIQDEDGDLFMTVESTTSSSTISNCMEVSSVTLDSAFITGAVNVGNGFSETAMFLNKNLLFTNNSSFGSGKVVRLYYKQAELQKLVTDFNAAYNSNKTISDIKIIRYSETGANDHNVANNNSANNYKLLTATLNNYGDDYYFEIFAGSTVNLRVTGEVRAALLTGQDLAIDNQVFSKIKIYPNPTNSFLNIYTDKKINSATVTDISGKSTKIDCFEDNIIDVRNLATGVYFIKIATDEGLFTEKFIKN